MGIRVGAVKDTLLPKIKICIKINTYMIPIDKFGNKIYPSKFMKLKENEKVLLSLGYKESQDKPNLFYKIQSEFRFFADMRGTEEVPIWRDTRPLFYWKFNSNIPNWERMRHLKIELINLFNSGCPNRLSFHAFNCEEFDETSAGIELDGENGIYIWDDGYCRFCGKDFKNEGSFCSSSCETKYEDTLKTSCEVCNKKIPFFKEIRHHVSYFPEKIIFVHASCHNKIHKTNLYPHLKPDQAEINKFYNKE